MRRCTYLILTPQFLRLEEILKRISSTYHCYHHRHHQHLQKRLRKFKQFPQSPPLVLKPLILGPVLFPFKTISYFFWYYYPHHTSLPALSQSPSDFKLGMMTPPPLMKPDQLHILLGRSLVLLLFTQVFLFDPHPFLTFRIGNSLCWGSWWTQGGGEIKSLMIPGRG